MLNSYHFKNYLDFIFEWIPQQLFFFCTFGYMCVLIVYKWTIPWGIERDTSMAPSIIGQMIALPLKLGSTEGKPLWDMESQENLQYYLLMIALICVPVMLIPKPFIIWLQSKKAPEEHRHPYDHESGSEIADLGKKLNEEFDAEDDLPPTPKATPAKEHHGGHD